MKLDKELREYGLMIEVVYKVIMGREVKYFNEREFKKYIEEILNDEKK